MPYHGIIGDYQKFRELAEKFNEETSSLIQKALEEDGSLDAHVGPQIWVKNLGFRID